jgi:excisionase family DNA binding protein
MDPDELLTVQEAAALLKVAPSWIYERTRPRKMPMRKLGGHVRIPKAELLRWIDTQDELAATEVG